MTRSVSWADSRKYLRGCAGFLSRTHAPQCDSSWTVNVASGTPPELYERVQILRVDRVGNMLLTSLKYNRVHIALLS